MCFTNTVFRP